MPQQEEISAMLGRLSSPSRIPQHSKMPKTEAAFQSEGATLTCRSGCQVISAHPCFNDSKSNQQIDEDALPVRQEDNAFYHYEFRKRPNGCQLILGACVKQDQAVQGPNLHATPTLVLSNNMHRYPVHLHTIAYINSSGSRQP